MAELSSAQDHIVGVATARVYSRSREVLMALAEVILVILPFVVARVIGRFINFLYLRPIAIVICVGVATLLLRRRGRRWNDAVLARPASWPKAFLGALGAFVAIALVSATHRGLGLALGFGGPSIDRLWVVREGWLVLAIAKSA
jgi:hypothetical protein